jgi:hypothetical protein
MAAMSRSLQQQIESIVGSLEKEGVRAAPVEETIDLALAHPDAVSDLALAVMYRFPEGGTFLDGAFSYMPQERWPQLIKVALDTLGKTPQIKNEAAESVIGYASLQCPPALHPHLDRIFSARPNAGTYYEFYPWRESGDQHFDFLQNVLEASDVSTDERKRAWTSMFQTRRTTVIDYAISHANIVSPPDWAEEAWLQAHLHLVGFHRGSDSLRRICPDALYHLQFGEQFFEPQTRPPWLKRIHPTWKLPEPIQTARFGGVGHGECSLCRQKLHCLFVLDPIPLGLGITGLKRLELDVCLSCLGWERQPLFYRHDEIGLSRNIGYDGPPVKPEFPVGPLREAAIGLAQTPRRWFWQDWGCSNSRENLSRIGGEPCWIQDAEYATCPSCENVMPYLFQLDSNLPTADGGDWLWGSGGIAYGFWCNECRVSGFLWQCT